MKLLHLAFLNGDPQGLQFFRKVDAQFRAIKKWNPASVCYIIGENVGNLDFSGFAFYYLDLKEFVFANESHCREVRYRIVAGLIRFFQPDIVYCRYPWADSHLYRLVQEFPIFIFEHQTKEIPELSFSKQYDTLRREKVYGSKVLSCVKGIVAVSGDYLAYELARAGVNKPAYTMTNGIDTERIALRNNRINNYSCIEILCLASFTVWHGYDRLIDGLRLYKGQKKWLVHMVGGGPELNTYQALVKKYSLEDSFKFWGRLDNDSYRSIVESSHIAIGALGLHRMDLHVTASLKNREYCALGIPFCFAGKDPDFDGNLPFVFPVPATDEPLDFEALLDYAQKVNTIAGLGSIMRTFAEENLSWNVKIKGLLSFFNSLESYPSGNENLTLQPLDWKTLLPEVEAELCSKRSQQSKIESILTRASFKQAMGETGLALSLYKEILENFTLPRPFLFRCLVELEKCSGADEPLVRYYSHQVLQRYAVKKRKTPLEGYRLASLYKKYGYFDQAIAIFEKLPIQRNPSFNGGVYFHLGEIFLAKNNLPKAREMFELCVQVIPGHKKAQSYMLELQSAGVTSRV